jgi:hypothetical protein
MVKTGFVERKWVRIALGIAVLAVWVSVAVRAMDGLKAPENVSNSMPDDQEPVLSPVLEVPYVAEFRGDFRDPFTPQWPPDTQVAGEPSEPAVTPGEPPASEHLKAVIRQALRLNGIVGKTAILEETGGAIHVVTVGDRLAINQVTLEGGSKPLELILLRIEQGEVELSSDTIRAVLTLSP